MRKSRAAATETKHAKGTETMSSIAQQLGDKAEYLLNFNSPKIPKERLHLPGPDVVDRLYAVSDRNNRVLGNLQRLVNHGRLAGTGYLSILPVDQGIEHSGGASFAKNPDYFDPENIVRLAMEGGCNNTERNNLLPVHGKTIR